MDSIAVPHAASVKPTLSLLTLLAVMYTSSISGGFGLEESVAAGGPWVTLTLLLIIPFVWCIPLALIVSELSCALPSNAGPAYWVRVCFGRPATISFVGWTAMLNFIDSSLYPALFAEYCTAAFTLTPTAKVVTTIVLCVICGAINAVGFRVVGRLSVVMMCCTLLPFACMFFLQLPAGFDWGRITYVPPRISWSIVLPVLCWNMSGYDAAGQIVEEVVESHRTIIRSLLTLTGVAWATYTFPVLVGCSAEGLRSEPFSEWHRGYWVRVAQAVGGPSVASLVLFSAAVATFGQMTTLMATTSRSLAGIGMVRVLPNRLSDFLAEYHPTLGTPIHAIVLNVAVTMVLSLTVTFRSLLVVDQILYCLKILMIISCFYQLRDVHPMLHRPFAAPSTKAATVLIGVAPASFAFVVIFSCLSSSSTVLFVSLFVVISATLVGHIGDQLVVSSPVMDV